MRVMEIYKNIKADDEIKKIILDFKNHNFKIDNKIDIILYDVLKDNNGILIYDNDNYSIFIDIGKLFINKSKDIINLLLNDNSYKKELYDYLNNNIYKVVANTFIVYSSVFLFDWFTSPIVKNVIDSYPCYNFITILNENIDDKLINDSNNLRTYNFSSYTKSDMLIWYYDFIKKDNIINNIYSYNVIRFKELLEIYDDFRNKTIPIILPKDNILEKKNLNFKKDLITLNGFKETNNNYFISNINSSCECYIYYEIDYDTFYDIEISLNLFNIFEGVKIIDINNRKYQSLFFYTLYDNKDMNYYDISNLETPSEKNICEDKMLSDIYTVVPIRYDDLSLIKKYASKENNFVINNLLTGLSFQENYEFGNENRNIKSYSNRIERYDLGTIYAYISEDPHYNYYNKSKLKLSKYKYPLRLIAVIDLETHTGVLYILNFGIKTKPTEYLDIISRNSIYLDYNEDYKLHNIHYKEAQNGAKICNLYKILLYKYKIKKVGMARNLMISPYLSNESKLNEDDALYEKSKEMYRKIKLSMMYGEVLFDDGEELGSIVDNRFNRQLELKYGDSIYDYSCINITKTGILQFNDTYRDYLAERIDFAVVNLFYIELVLMEDAAIQIADIAISDFINDYKIKNVDNNKLKNFSLGSKYVLDKLEEIQEEYAKTLDFWDVQANFYSSKVFLTKLRKKFEIEKDIQSLKRNRVEIQEIYSSKQNKKSQRNGFILAVLGFVLTLLNLVDVFNKAASDDSVKILPWVDYIYENMKALYVIRIFVLILLLYLLAKFILNRIFEFIKKRGNSK